MRGSGSSRSGSGAALGFRGECYRRVRLRSATWPAVPTVPAYIRMQVGTAARYVWAHPRAGSVRQMGRDQRRRRPDRGRRLQGEASPGEIEMVAAEGIHVAVIEAPRSQSEDEQDRRPVLQETRQGGGVRRFLRIRSARGHDCFAELGREPSLRELERLEATEMRQLSEILASFPDACRAGDPGRNILGGPQVFLERKPGNGAVAIECEGDWRGACDRPAMGLGQANRVVRIVEAECHPALSHTRVSRSPYFPMETTRRREEVSVPRKPHPSSMALGPTRPRKARR